MEAARKPTFDGNKMIGGVECYVRITDIFNQGTDAILVPVPLDRPGQGGLFTAAQEHGAGQACEALRNWHLKHHQKFKPGEVLTVTSGLENRPYITFAASVPDSETGKQVNFAYVVGAVISALEDLHKRMPNATADEPACLSVPLMGTGQMGWLDKEQSALAICTGIACFAKANPMANMRVNFCTLTPEDGWLVNHVLRNQKERYTEMSDDEVIAMQGNAVPPSQTLSTHVSPSPLLAKLNALFVKQESLRL